MNFFHKEKNIYFPKGCILKYVQGVTSFPTGCLQNALQSGKRFCCYCCYYHRDRNLSILATIIAAIATIFEEYVSIYRYCRETCLWTTAVMVATGVIIIYAYGNWVLIYCRCCSKIHYCTMFIVWNSNNLLKFEFCLLDLNWYGFDIKADAFEVLILCKSFHIFVTIW